MPVQLSAPSQRVEAALLPARICVLLSGRRYPPSGAV